MSSQDSLARKKGRKLYTVILPSIDEGFSIESLFTAFDSIELFSLGTCFSVLLHSRYSPPVSVKGVLVTGGKLKDGLIHGHRQMLCSVQCFSLASVQTFCDEHIHSFILGALRTVLPRRVTLCSKLCHLQYVIFPHLGTTNAI
jgi:hypothetical protein